MSGVLFLLVYLIVRSNVVVANAKTKSEEKPVHRFKYGHIIYSYTRISPCEAYLLSFDIFIYFCTLFVTYSIDKK